MTIQIDPRPGATVLKISGDLVAASDRALATRVADLLDAGATRLVLELSAVGFVNSGGLGELVQVTARANTRQARLVLANPSPFLTGVLQTTHLDRFFEMAATLDEALALLK